MSSILFALFNLTKGVSSLFSLRISPLFNNKRFFLFTETITSILALFRRLFKIVNLVIQSKHDAGKTAADAAQKNSFALHKWH